MVKRRAGRTRVLEDRLLRKMTQAARAAGRSRGRTRMRAIARYIEVLQGFTDFAIETLKVRAAARRRK